MLYVPYIGRSPQTTIHISLLIVLLLLLQTLARGHSECKYPGITGNAQVSEAQTKSDT